MGMTIAEKILARTSGRPAVRAGEYVWANVDRAMSTDLALSAAALEKHAVEKLWDPDRIVVINDHDIPPSNVHMAERYAKSRALAIKYGVKNFYEIGRHGISHQAFIEHGFARPGELVVGLDSHTCTYGALNCASRGIYDEFAFVLATGRLWFRVPETMRFELAGAPPPFITGKDIVLHLIGTYGVDAALNRSIDAIPHLSLAERITIANMGIEMGAKFAIFEADRRVLDYVTARTSEPVHPVYSDPDAAFDAVYRVDIDRLEPQVACPHDLRNVRPVGEVTDTRIDQAFLGGCTNGRLEDLAIAAEILKGRKVHPRVRMIVTPASQAVYKEALRRGIIETLVEAEALVTQSTCGPCAGVHNGVLAAGEVCISSTNRNVRGRMGSPDALVYLASPAVVAASAVAGAIADPRDLIPPGRFMQFKGIDETVTPRRADVL